MKVENTIILWKRDKKWFVVNTRYYFGYSTLKYVTLMKIIRLWIFLEFKNKLKKYCTQKNKNYFSYANLTKK